MFRPESSKNFQDTWGAVLSSEKKPDVKVPGPESIPANDDKPQDLTAFAEEEAPPTPKPGSEAERVLKDIEAKKTAGEIW